MPTVSGPKSRTRNFQRHWVCAFLFPRDFLDLLDLRRLERSGTADDREIDHSELLHRLDRLVGETALAADRADAVRRAERLVEAHHRARRWSPSRCTPSRSGRRRACGRPVRCGGGTRRWRIHRRLDALVEDPDLRAVADPDDVPLDDDLVSGAELEDLGLVRDREGHFVRGHQPTPPPWVGADPAALETDSTIALTGSLRQFRTNLRASIAHASRSNSVVPSAAICALARRAAQHW